MRSYIQQHRSEFQIGQSSTTAGGAESIMEGDDGASMKSFRNEHRNGELYTRNRDVDNPEGIDGRKSMVGPLTGTISTKTILENVTGFGTSIWEGILNCCSCFDGTTSTGPLIIVIVLVLSNIWTFNSSRSEVVKDGRPSSNYDRRGIDREGGKEVAEAVREVLKDWFKENGSHSAPVGVESGEDGMTGGPDMTGVREEVMDIQEIIARLEIRLNKLKNGLPSLEPLIL